MLSLDSFSKAAFFWTAVKKKNKTEMSEKSIQDLWVQRQTQAEPKSCEFWFYFYLLLLKSPWGRSKIAHRSPGRTGARHTPSEAFTNYLGHLDSDGRFITWINAEQTANRLLSEDCSSRTTWDMTRTYEAYVTLPRDERGNKFTQ